MNHTTNYNLNQWEDGDVVRREDFNADNAAIDAALKSVSDAVPEIVFGTYTGNGEQMRTIELGRRPRIMFVEPSHGIRNNSTSGPNGALAAQGYPATRSGDIVLSLTDTGFIVRNSSASGRGVFTNVNTIVYHYVVVF